MLCAVGSNQFNASSFPPVLQTCFISMPPKHTNSGHIWSHLSVCSKKERKICGEFSFLMPALQLPIPARLRASPTRSVQQKAHYSKHNESVYSRNNPRICAGNSPAWTGAGLQSELLGLCLPNSCWKTAAKKKFVVFSPCIFCIYI